MSTILIVEDHDESRYLLEQTLTSRGHQVIAAKNGAEALQLSRSTPPEIIISDIMMPVMNGFKLCSKIKKDPALCHIPFIFYTATFVEETDEKLAMSLGASRFLIKPTEGDLFIRILNDVLKEHREGVLVVPECPLEDEEILLNICKCFEQRRGETYHRVSEMRCLSDAEYTLGSPKRLTV